MKPIFTLVLACFIAASVSAQDSCESPTTAYMGVNFASPLAAANAPGPFQCYTGNGDELFGWYTFTSAVDTGITVSTDLAVNVGRDTRMAIYSGSCGALVCAGNDDDSGSGYLSVTTFPAEAGVLYYIVFDSYWGTSEYTSPLQFQISEYDEPDPIVGLITFDVATLPGGGYTDCVVDMNGDFLDDVVYVSGSNLTILYQGADGTFSNQTFNTGYVQNDPSWSIAAGDFNNDGYNDLLYGGGGGASFVWSNADNSAYYETHDNQYIFSQRTNTIDINNDGNLDAFVCHDIAANVYYTNDGMGNMTWHQGGLGENGGNYGSVWIDYDNDCDMDMFIAKCGSDNIDQLHRNNGDGTFTSVGAAAGVNDPTQSWSSAWADYDNDSDMDVFIGASSNGSGGHKLYRNNGDGTFTNVTAGSGFEMQTGTSIENMPGDFDNDGWVDIQGAGGIFMLNNHDMTFTPSICPFYYGPSGDLNNDGYLDFVNGSTVYYNTMSGNNYLTVNTIGTESNKSGIGARITVTSALGSQIRDVRSGESFSTMHSLNSHFGLGTDTEVSVMTICWPSGINDVIYNPPINQAINVVEGIGLVASVKESSAASSLTVYPNPVQNELRVQADVMNASSVYTIYDMTGHRVMSGKPQAMTIDVSSLPSGLYLIEVATDGKAQRTNFTKF